MTLKQVGHLACNLTLLNMLPITPDFGGDGVQMCWRHSFTISQPPHAAKSGSALA
jgi:hypothetical protein